MFTVRRTDSGSSRSIHLWFAVCLRRCSIHHRNDAEENCNESETFIDKDCGGGNYKLKHISDRESHLFTVMSHLLLSTAAMRRRLVGVVGSSGGGFIRNMNAMILVRGGSCCSSDITVRSPRHRKLVVDFQDKPLFGRRPLLFSSASATSSTSAEPPLEEDVASESLLDKYYIGKVKFFDRKKGYGYIQPGGNAKKHGEMEGYKNALLLKGQDIYVHASAFMHSNFLEGDQIPHLNRKDHVRFRIEANTQSKKLEPNRNHDTNTEKKNEANDEGGDDQSTNNGSNAGGSDENFALPPVQWRAVNVTFANGEPSKSHCLF